MQELISWTDKTIEDISNADLFKLYFKDSQLTKDANDFFLTNLKKGLGLVLSKSKVIRTIHLYRSSESFFKEEAPLKS